jgi:MazG family protein
LTDAVLRLECLLDGLLDPQEGCPWDLTQTYRTISEDLLEEAYELREAILSGSPEDIKEEAGDLLFLLFFLGRLSVKGDLGFGTLGIADQAADKMVRRHPHVFKHADKLTSPEEVLVQWHAIKRGEKKKAGLLDSVPTALPALARNNRLGSKASKAGFDWEKPEDVRKKLDEELGELDCELAKGDPANNQERLMAELGDALAALANLARHLGFSAEKALDAHNRRFIERVGKMSAELAKEGRVLEDASQDELERLWQKAKRP